MTLGVEPDIEKWQLLHKWRLTSAILSEKVALCLAYQAAVHTGQALVSIKRAAGNVTTEQSAKSVGVLRAISLSDHCRSRLHAEMRAGFFKRHFHRPPSDESS